MRLIRRLFHFFCLEICYVENRDALIIFGDHLRKIRIERNMTQVELADMAEVNRRTIQRIELGELNASLKILISITKALDIPLRELMDIEVA